MNAMDYISNQYPRLLYIGNAMHANKGVIKFYLNLDDGAIVGFYKDKETIKQEKKEQREQKDKYHKAVKITKSTIYTEDEHLSDKTPAILGVHSLKKKKRNK